MATSPSKRFEDGVLVKRAIATDVVGDPDPGEDLTQRDYKEPDRSTMADRLKARESAEKKAVSSSDAENKGIKASKAAKK